MYENKLPYILQSIMGLQWTLETLTLLGRLQLALIQHYTQVQRNVCLYILQKIKVNWKWKRQKDIQRPDIPDTLTGQKWCGGDKELWCPLLKQYYTIKHTKNQFKKGLSILLKHKKLITDYKCTNKALLAVNWHASLNLQKVMSLSYVKSIHILSIQVWEQRYIISHTIRTQTMSCRNVLLNAVC